MWVRFLNIYSYSRELKPRYIFGASVLTTLLIYLFLTKVDIKIQICILCIIGCTIIWANFSKISKHLFVFSKKKQIFKHSHKVYRIYDYLLNHALPKEKFRVEIQQNEFKRIKVESKSWWSFRQTNWQPYTFVRPNSLRWWSAMTLKNPWFFNNKDFLLKHHVSFYRNDSVIDSNSRTETEQLKLKSYLENNNKIKINLIEKEFKKNKFIFGEGVLKIDKIYATEYAYDHRDNSQVLFGCYALVWENGDTNQRQAILALGPWFKEHVIKKPWYYLVDINVYKEALSARFFVGFDVEHFALRTKNKTKFGQGGFYKVIADVKNQGYPRYWYFDPDWNKKIKIPIKIMLFWPWPLSWNDKYRFRLHMRWLQWVADNVRRRHQILDGVEFIIHSIHIPFLLIPYELKYMIFTYFPKLVRNWVNAKIAFAKNWIQMKIFFIKKFIYDRWMRLTIFIKFRIYVIKTWVQVKIAFINKMTRERQAPMSVKRRRLYYISLCKTKLRLFKLNRENKRIYYKKWYVIQKRKWYQIWYDFIEPYIIWRNWVKRRIKWHRNSWRWRLKMQLIEKKYKWVKFPLLRVQKFFVWHWKYFVQHTRYNYRVDRPEAWITIWWNWYYRIKLFFSGKISEDLMSIYILPWYKKYYINFLFKIFREIGRILPILFVELLFLLEKLLNKFKTLFIVKRDLIFSKHNLRPKQKNYSHEFSKKKYLYSKITESSAWHVKLHETKLNLLQMEVQKDLYQTTQSDMDLYFERISQDSFIGFSSDESSSKSYDLDVLDRINLLGTYLTGNQSLESQNVEFCNNSLILYRNLFLEELKAINLSPAIFTNYEMQICSFLEMDKLTALPTLYWFDQIEQYDPLSVLGGPPKLTFIRFWMPRLDYESWMRFNYYNVMNHHKIAFAINDEISDHIYDLQSTFWAEFCFNNAGSSYGEVLLHSFYKTHKFPWIYENSRSLQNYLQNEILLTIYLKKNYIKNIYFRQKNKTIIIAVKGITSRLAFRKKSLTLTKFEYNYVISTCWKLDVILKTNNTQVSFLI